MGQNATTSIESSSTTTASVSNGASELLQPPDLWRAQQLFEKHPPPPAQPTGFAALDAHLHGGGWPRAGLGEFLLHTLGIGELRLLAPALAALSQSETRWVGWVNPPFIPYAPALEALGIDAAKMLLIHPKNHKDALWALEQASRSGTCSVVMAWLDEAKLKLKDTRRLQLAAKQGNTFVCLFRPHAAADQNSMAELRFQIMAPKPGELTVCIKKRRNGWPMQDLHLDLSNDLVPEAVSEQIDLWRSFRRRRLESDEYSGVPQRPPGLAVAHPATH